MAEADRAARLSADDVAVRTLGGWRDVWRKLRLAARALEGDCARDLRGLSAAEAAELRAEGERAGERRAQRERELWQGMARVRGRVLALGPALHVEGAREAVAGAERDLAIFREQHRQETCELAAEERCLTDALEAMEARFETWLGQPSAARPSAAAPRRAASTSALVRQPAASAPARQRPRSAGGADGAEALRRRTEALAAAEASEGGPTGGWAQEDHEAFLRALRRHGARGAAFLEEAQRQLPHLGHEALVEHVAWLRRHEERRGEQRRLLAEWRERRGASTEQPSHAQREVEAEKRRLRERAQREDASAAEKKRQLAEWRERRAELEAQAAAQASRQAEAKRRREAAAREEREAQRLAVEEFRRFRAASEAATKEALRAAPAPVAAEVRRRIAGRSAALLERAAQAKAEEAVVEFAPPRRAYEHVPCRVYEARPRAASESGERPSEATRFGPVHGDWAHQALPRPCRALPAWRPRYGA